MGTNAEIVCLLFYQKEAASQTSVISELLFICPTLFLFLIKSLLLFVFTTVKNEEGPKE